MSETRLKVESYKLHWNDKQRVGGAAMILAGPLREVPVRADSVAEVEALGRLLSTFSPVFYDAVNGVLYTELLAVGTTRD